MRLKVPWLDYSHWKTDAIKKRAELNEEVCSPLGATVIKG